MRAAVVHELGAPPRAGDWAEPERKEGEALIQVTAAAVNPIDISASMGTFYGGKPDPPYVAGREGAGTVLEGDGVERGTRVRFEVAGGLGGKAGSLAERVAAPEDGLLEIPRGLDDHLAAALGIAGMTAWLALEWRALLQQGETVLVLAATGAVGRIAVQSAKLLGAGRVVAAARDAAELERVRELGADEVVVIGRELDEDTAALREAAGGDGPDVVVDPLWGQPVRAATEAAAPRARIVHLGQTAGPETTLRSGAVRGKMLSILGFTLYGAPLERRLDAWKRLCEELAAGNLTLELEEIPLDRVEDAWERQQRFPQRKILVIP
jgi:NADPH2:quinone reductase